MSSTEIEVEGNMFGASESYDEDESEKHSLFLGDLSIYCDEKDIESAFAPYGNIVDIRIQRSKETSRALSYGFIEFGTQESAAAALREMNYFLLKGRPLRIRWAADRKNPIKSAATPHDSAATVYVRFLTQADNVVISEESLRELFNTYGPVFDCAIKKLSQEQKGTRIKGYAFVSFDSGALAQGGVDVAGVEAAFRACTDLRNRVINQVRYRCELGNRLQKQAAAAGMTACAATASVVGLVPAIGLPMGGAYLPVQPYAQGDFSPQTPTQQYHSPQQHQQHQQPQQPQQPLRQQACMPQQEGYLQQHSVNNCSNLVSYSYCPTPVLASPYASRDGTPTNYQLRLQQQAQAQAHAFQAQAQAQAQAQQQHMQHQSPHHSAHHQGQAHQGQPHHQQHGQQQHSQQQHGQGQQPHYVPQMGYTPMPTPTNGNLHSSVGMMAQSNTYQAHLAQQAQAQLQAQALAQAQLHAPPQYVQYQYYPSQLNSGCNSGAATPVSAARAAMSHPQQQQGHVVMPNGMLMMPVTHIPQHVYPNMNMGNNNMNMNNINMNMNMNTYPPTPYTPTSYAHQQHQQQQQQQQAQHQAQQHQALQHHAQQQQGILKELSCSQHFAQKGFSLSIKTHSFDEPVHNQAPQRTYASDVTPRESYLQRKLQQPNSRRAQYNNNNNSNNNYSNNNGHNTSTTNNTNSITNNQHNLSVSNSTSYSNPTSTSTTPHNHTMSSAVNEHKPVSRRGSNDSITTTSLYLASMSIDETAEFDNQASNNNLNHETGTETPVSV